MKTLPRIALATLVLSLASSLCHATAPPRGVTPGRTIEAFVSLESLFPVEGTHWVTPYRPVPAYASPQGAVVGKVIIANPQCVSAAEAVQAACGDFLQPVLVLNDGGRHDLPTQEWSYETDALVTYAPAVVRGAVHWSQIEYAGGTFWIATSKKEVRPWEEVSSVVEKFDLFCSQPGSCTAPSAAMLADVERMREGKFEVSTCYPEPYEIEERVVVRGKAYYKVKLPEFTGRARPRNLPATGYIPTRLKNGQHTGTFYARGC